MTAPSGGIILHPGYVGSRSKLLRGLNTSRGGQIIFVVGLSGAGKSEIRYWAMRSYAGDASKWPTGHLPALAVRATPSDRSNFSPKEFDTRLYFELLEPNVDWLAPRSQVEGPDGAHQRADSRLSSELWRHVRTASTGHRLRHQVERMAISRAVRAIFIEEGASLTYTGERKKPSDHLYNCMCMAEEIGCILVLFGVPRMAILWEGEDQIQRRSRFVFVDRYRLSVSADKENFERLVLTLGRRYRFSNKQLLRKCMGLVYIASAGVFGNVVAYLTRADDLRVGSGEPTITMKHMEEAVGTERSLETLHAEANLFDSLKAPSDRRFISRFLESTRKV